ncbi:MAG TPA: SEC-C metal-binding domain-containing protein [Bryobacteraceae bacterium]
MPRTDLVFDPDRLQTVPVYQLLEAASHAYLGIDHRFLHAILDHPERSIPDLVRFAGEDHGQDTVFLDDQLLDIFRVIGTPQALPFYAKLVREDPAEIEDDLVKAFVQLGAASVDPLLALMQEFDGEDPGDVPFVLSVLRVRDDRILQVLIRRLEYNPGEAALCLEIYGDRKAIPALESALAGIPPGDPEHNRIKSLLGRLESNLEHVPEPLEPFDIWELYPEKDSPPLELLGEDDCLAMLDVASAELRGDIVESFRSADLSNNVRARILALAKNDPDPAVRGECWETFGDIADEPEIRRAMLAVLADPAAAFEEKGGAAVALAQQVDNDAVFQAIEELYADPRSRAKGLKAMVRSFDRRFAGYPPKHLDDADPEIRRQAIWGVGYMRLAGEAPRLETFFDQDAFRSDALFAYALSAPADISRGRIRSLLKKVDEMAGGLKPEEEELVKIALDQRLMLAGMKAVFFEEELDDDEPQPAVSDKVGRNDPCPCGSGKKYKKCCGA